MVKEELENLHGIKNFSDFAEDVNAALKYLRTRDEVQKNNIALIGHIGRF